MSLTLKHIEQMAPDQASLSAAAGLRKPAKWPVLAMLDEGSLIWGECQGSGSTPYRAIASLADLGYKCTCPSRKFPCKHVLALLWQHVETPDRFGAAPSTPDWVQDWLARRRPKTASAATAAPNGTDTAKSIAISAEAAEAPAAPRDEKAEARAARQRERVKAEREAAVLAGLAELERWIADQAGAGFAAFASMAQEQCRVAARRLVDAKAPALAAAVDAIPSELFALPDVLRADFLIYRLGSIALLINAWRRRDRLPPLLVEDMRRVIGWTVRREELLADAAAARVTGNWLVCATRAEVQPDKLRRLETWLVREPDENSQSGNDYPFALLLDYVPVTAGGGSFAYAPGERFRGELAFYPSATPLRAVLVERINLDGRGVWPQSTGLADAHSGYLRTLARNPFIGDWPLVASGVTIEERGSGGIWLAGGEGGMELRIAPRQAEALLPMSGLAGVSIVGLWNGRLLTMLAANTPLGPWWES